MLFRFDKPNVWDALKHADKPIVLYGMGNGADKVLDEMKKRGITPAGVMASDDFVRYQEFRGFTVKKQSDLENELGDFIIALCFASSLPDVTAHIRRVAKEHELLVPNVPVFGDDILDDKYLESHKTAIEDACSLLADDRSRKVFKGALDFFYTGRLPYLDAIESDKSEAFGNILRLQGESYLDLGAYRGDTVDEFLHYTNGYTQITAVEPSPKNYSKLCEHLAPISRCKAILAGIADREGVMYVTKGGGRMAALNTEGGIKVPVTTVDEIDCRPTYIKVDVEGMEDKMLSGAVGALQSKPKLNLAAYHRTGDFFELILRLHNINPDYKIHLRKHHYIPCWDLNIYAI